MYQKSFQKRGFSRGNFAHRGQNRGQSHSRPNRGQSHSRSNRASESIPTSHYVNKAAPAVTQAPVTIQHTFDDFPVDLRIKRNIASHGYNTPTPIQDQAIPVILQGKDIIGIANTGTGKTAAFLVPIINKIVRNPQSRALIVVPTRELAVQINTELGFLAKTLYIQSVLIMGGASINRQIMDLRRDPHILIATPGRLKDLLQRRAMSLQKCTTIVLDEVDRMVDIGFIRDVKYIVSQMPTTRQSLFFSATLSPETNIIAQSFLNNPVTISVKVKEMPGQIDQDIIRVNKHEKMTTLQSLLRKQEFNKVLIFGRTKWGVEKLSKALQQNGFLADSIHGNKSQNQRLRALDRFRNNQLQVLVATDVVARGVDIQDVSHVINYDEPNTYTDYIHRIGRTGRANKQGKALTFVE